VRRHLHRLRREHYVKLIPCAHCGRPCGDYAGGHGSVWHVNEKRATHLCHPNASGRPDCYHLVTVHGEELGARLGDTYYRQWGNWYERETHNLVEDPKLEALMEGNYQKVYFDVVPGSEEDIIRREKNL
jgi:hypothetical protein